MKVDFEVGKMPLLDTFQSWATLGTCGGDMLREFSTTNSGFGEIRNADSDDIYTYIRTMGSSGDIAKSKVGKVAKCPCGKF